MPFEAADEALWDLTFDSNVKGAYFQILALLPLLDRGASAVLHLAASESAFIVGSEIIADGGMATL